MKKFLYKFWFVDEISVGIHYRTRIYCVRELGKWILGHSPIIVIAIVLAILYARGTK